MTNSNDMTDMNKQTEAMKLALESFSVIAISDNLDWIRHQAEHQAAALREALAEQPAQRTWVGLTNGEWMNIVNKDHAWYGQRPDEVAHEVAKLVEAKLKEKNA